MRVVVAFTGILLSIMAVLICRFWIIHRPTFPFALILVASLAPGGLLVAISAVWHSIAESGRMVIYVVLFLGIISVAISVAVNLMATRDHGFYVTRDITEYGALVGTDSPRRRDYVAHFPKDTAECGKDTQFFWGKNIDVNLLELRCRVQPEKAKEIRTSFEQRAIYEQRGLPYDRWAWVNFRNSNNNGFAELSQTFTIFVLQASFGPGVQAPNWRHTYSSGIALNCHTGDVIYWACFP